jgi:hypothetical protein
MSNWIKCSERMPERDRRVLWLFPPDFVFIGKLIEGRVADVIEGDDCEMGAILLGEVSGWQPLPEAPT